MRILPLLAQEADWAGSVLDAVGDVAERAPHRWDGGIGVSESVGSISTSEAEDVLHVEKRPLIMPRRVFTTIKDAFDRRDGRQVGKPPSADELQSQWDDVVRATGYMAAQAYQKTGPMAGLQGHIVPEEIALDEGLAGVWTGERLAEVEAKRQGDKLLSPDGVPDPHFRFAGGPATAATRDLLSEVLRQQGKELSSENYVSLCNTLQVVPSHQRWAAIAQLLPGGEKFEPEILGPMTEVMLRPKFGAAVDDPGSTASQALREVAVMLKRGADRQEADSALPPPGTAAPTHAATKGWRKLLGGSRVHGKGD
jgi:hypothetical protein